MFKIVAYSILKNEQNNVVPWIESLVKSVNQIVLLDTGSEDSSVSLIKEMQNKYPGKIELHQALIDPFDFSIARNMAMEQAQKHCDFYDLLMWLDLDERIDPDWYQKLAKLVVDNGIDLKRYLVLQTKMIFAENNGVELMTYSQNKIHTARGFRWKYSCHEILVSLEGEPDYIYSGIGVRHLKDNSKPRDYMPLLAKQHVENPTDLRTLYYLAREHSYEGNWQITYNILQDIEKCEGTEAQRVDAYLLQADACSKLEIDPRASLYRALSIEPTSVEAAYTFAQHYYEKQDAQSCFYWATHGIELLSDIENTQQNVIYNKQGYLEWKLYDLAAYSLNIFGDYRQAFTIYGQLLSEKEAYIPEKDKLRIGNNLMWLQTKLEKV
tara:strand:+ start:52974 stop:54116 length:1143 start_codon:yes stop_codon:yes gene_type:complete